MMYRTVCFTIAHRQSNVVMKAYATVEADTDKDAEKEAWEEIKAVLPSLPQEMAKGYGWYEDGCEIDEVFDDSE